MNYDKFYYDVEKAKYNFREKYGVEPNQVIVSKHIFDSIKKKFPNDICYDYNSVYGTLQGMELTLDNVSKHTIKVGRMTTNQ